MGRPCPAKSMNAQSEIRPATPPGLATKPPGRGALRRLRLPILAGLLVLAVVAGNWWLLVGRWLEATDNAFLQGDIAVLGARLEGHVAAIRVSDNQRVSAGDPLIELDQGLWKARLAETVASLAEAEAAIGTNRQQVIQQRAQINAVQAALDQARAEQARAAGDARRAGELVGSGWTSRQSADRAVSEIRKADGAVAAGLAQLAVARQQLDVLQAALGQQEAR